MEVELRKEESGELAGGGGEGIGFRECLAFSTVQNAGGRRDQFGALGVCKKALSLGEKGNGRGLKKGDGDEGLVEGASR